MTSEHNASEWSELQTEVMKTPFPMLFGSSQAVDGYCSLELGERSNALHTLRKHRVEISLWYRGLKLLLDPFEGEWVLPDEEPLKSAYILRGDLLGLEISSVKAALDLILAGYYSLAFGAIRHMLESSAQSMYVYFFPDKTDAWELGNKNPRMRFLIDQIMADLKKRGFESEQVHRFDHLYKSWELMSKGIHPTGEGLLQTRPTVKDPRNIVGPVYRSNLTHIAFDHGLWAVHMLLLLLPSLNRTDDGWQQDFDNWSDDRQTWRTSLRGRDDLRDLWSQEAEELLARE